MGACANSGPPKPVILSEAKDPYALDPGALLQTLWPFSVPVRKLESMISATSIPGNLRYAQDDKILGEDKTCVSDRIIAHDADLRP